MGAARWIGGILGAMTMGPIGALAGYALGRILEKSFDTEKIESRHGEYAGSAGRGEAYDNTEYEARGQRNGFLFSMLVMASYVIKADGKIMHSEMEYVRRFLRTTFGTLAEQEGEQILLRLFEQRKKMEAVNPNAFKNTIRDCGRQIAENVTYEARLQMLDFLVEIAKADGHIAPEEIAALREVCEAMGMSASEVDSMLSLSGDSLEDAYKVLEIPETATDSEVKAAYRRMALKHHPDKVASLGEDVKRAAEKKFQEINNAKERIYKARGIK